MYIYMYIYIYIYNRQHYIFNDTVGRTTFLGKSVILLLAMDTSYLAKNKKKCDAYRF